MLVFSNLNDDAAGYCTDIEYIDALQTLTQAVKHVSL